MDNDSGNAYFCFERAVKDGWNDLVNNWEQVKEVEFETNDRGNKKVVSLYATKESDIIV